VPDTNPYSQIASQYWSLLEDSSSFKSLVPAGNRVKFIGGIFNPREVKVARQAADLPQVAVTYVGQTDKVRNTSCSTAVVTYWTIEVRTYPFKLENKFPLQWLILQILHNGKTAFRTLTYGGYAFCRYFKPMQEPSPRIKRMKDEQGITGWDTLVACRNDLWFPYADITPTYPEPE
jgi:hypothetical protein